jgi:predicted phosphodiesterase
MRDKRYAIIGDVHGNLDALEAVLDDAREQGVHEFVCVGDVVGYNAEPAACLDRVMEIAGAVVRGNHDHYCSHDECLEDFHPLAANVVDWTRRQLSSEQIRYLRDLPLWRMIAGFCVVHSTLDMPDKWGYVYDTLEAAAHFNYQTVAVCFYGHTHLPIMFEQDRSVVRGTYGTVKIELGKKYFVNVGSVGQPRDGDPRAAYVIYDPKGRELQLRRVGYDVARAQAKIRQVGLPERLATRLGLGK